MKSGRYQLAAPLELGKDHSGVKWLGEVGATVSGGAIVGGWKSANPQKATESRRDGHDRGAAEGCAADYCSGRDNGKPCPVCCGQAGRPAPPANTCQKTAPYCAGYVYDKHFGACQATKPPLPKPLQVVTADVSALGAAAQDRHLFVNNARARRARLPDDVSEALFKGAKLTPDGYTLGPGANSSVLQAGAEFVFPQSTSPWTEPRCAVASVNSTNIIMLQPCWIDLYHKACGQGVKGTPVGRGGYVENAGVNYVSNPGDFALDHDTKTLHYALRPGEDPATLNAIMPVLDVLVNVTGASDITFESLRFEHATWLRPGQADGYVEQQTGACTVGSTPVPTDDYCNDGERSHWHAHVRAAWLAASWLSIARSACAVDFVWSVKSPGNIAVLSSQRVGFEKCEFTRLGGTAVDITWSEGCMVVDSYFHDISGAGVQLGSFQYPLGAQR